MLVGPARVGLPVVGEDSLDPHAAGGEEDRRLQKRAGGAAAGLVGDVGDVADPARIVHEDLAVVVADLLVLLMPEGARVWPISPGR